MDNQANTNDGAWRRRAAFPACQLEDVQAHGGRRFVFVLVIVLLIAVACMGGTRFPRIFVSWWFVSVLGVLALSLVACTVYRFRAFGRSGGPERVRVFGLLCTHVSLLLVLVGGGMRAVWGENGHIAFRVGEAVTGFVGSRGPVTLPFAVGLVAFDVQRYPPTESASGFQTGAIKAYRSTLQIQENGKIVCKKTVAVNAPFSYGGYSFYQAGCNPDDLDWTSLQVVRDPGIPFVFSGFALIIFGLMLVFWIAPMAGGREKRNIAP